MKDKRRYVTMTTLIWKNIKKKKNNRSTSNGIVNISNELNSKLQLIQIINNNTNKIDNMFFNEKKKMFFLNIHRNLIKIH